MSPARMIEQSGGRVTRCTSYGRWILLREDGLSGGIAVSWTRAWMNNDGFELPPDPVRGIFLNLKRLWARYTPCCASII
jgi:hypothetical protein